MTNSACHKKQRVVVFFGMTASGKSYLAKRWAEKHGFPYFNTDVIRKELAGIESTRSCAQSIDCGIYSPQFSRKTYDAVLDRTVQALRNNCGVPCAVMDGSYQYRRERQLVVERFEKWCEIIFILCHCPEKVTKKRLADRMEDPETVSDGSWQIYLRQKDIFEKPDELFAGQLLELDTNASLEYLIDHLDQLLNVSSLNQA
jgi:predicted kinase